MIFAKSGRVFGIFFVALFGILLGGCGKSDSDSDSSSTRTVSGKITYKRLPIKVDSSGYPQGLETPDKAETLPLRGVVLRAVYPKEETAHDNSKVKVWLSTSWSTTGSEGTYSIDLPEDDTIPIYLEAMSIFSYSGNSSSIRIIADSGGMHSTTYLPDRPIYSYRVGLDGSRSENDPTPTAIKSGKTTLDVEIGLEDKWWIGHQDVRYALTATLDASGTGSKIAAIIDTAYKAGQHFGNPTPGYLLDIHYRQGISEPFGTYVEYDRERTPLAYDLSGTTGGALHFFGSVRGGPQGDDAWDEGILLSMFARNNLRTSGYPSFFQFPSKFFPGFDPRNQSLKTNLQPTMALAEGLPDAMAAVVLKTPFLTSGAGTLVRDVRDIPGLPLDVFSGPTIAAFTWELLLKANGIASPGTPDTWKNIDPLSISRFYKLASAYNSGEDNDEEETSATLVDLPSMFTQLARLREEKSNTEPIDLAKIFTDDVITQIATPFFGTIWPRPSEGQFSSFMADWGADPNSTTKPLPSISFSMQDAQLDAEGIFSNLTHQENFVSKLTLSKDTAYWLSVVPTPALPNNISIELKILGSQVPPLIFNSSSLSPQRVVLLGNADTPYTYLLFFSLKSQTVIQPDTQINVRLDPAF